MEKNKNIKWYIVQVISNYEQKVKEDLDNREFEDKDTGISEIYIPFKYHQTKTKKIKKKPLFPGYIYVKLDMTDKSWYIIRNTQYVTGIVGSSGQRTKPTPIPEEQIAKIKQDEINLIKNYEELQKVTDNKEAIANVKYEIDDYVVIKQGEFIGKKGRVKEISFIKQNVIVEIEMFSRKIVIDLPLDYLEKV
ncbi:/ nusG / Transcription antitermination protein nusG /:539797 Reverse [Candidatus Hepatoplasma crinochetorum]|uniref:Transcription termination/antitermination protein NusG n=1 Tax=Candidatus Hepatoplasma crinochetorum TaxID=295596 RepID=A0A0G7ZLM3_9MOLU|nr:/ nusG / Transcription antitermination protein nusG /:539797 Reverse [Candidatus Hepatoplasma crinochetorum]